MASIIHNNEEYSKPKLKVVTYGWYKKLKYGNIDDLDPLIYWVG